MSITTNSQTVDNIIIKNIETNGSNPSIVINTSFSSAIITGNNISGTIVFTTNSVTFSGGLLTTITYTQLSSRVMSNVMLSPGNTETALIMPYFYTSTYTFNSITGIASFQILCETSLTNFTTYVLRYLSIS